MSQASPILITGGAGFIGSHTCLVLLQAGHRLVVLDDFSNSAPQSLERVVELVGGDAAERLQVVEGDIRRREDLDRAFDAGLRFSPSAEATVEASGEARDEAISAVLHFAGLKAVAESTALPLRYWDVNVTGSLRLVEAMAERGCRTLVFSSSATVYGIPETVPIPETAPVHPINPYGHTKAAVEQLLADLHASSFPVGAGHASSPQAGTLQVIRSSNDHPWRIARLRYFNPVGAHPSGLIGEDPLDEPSNLFPLLGQVASGQRSQLQIYGDDWPTADGTGERDFIHVMDLAEGHLAALRHLQDQESRGQEALLTLNLGSGSSHTVQQVVQAYERACGRSLPTQVVARRPGDAARSVADPWLAQRLLGWRCRRDLQTMCKDSWRWQSGNPKGYRS
ncbi:UDP-glucose 4-epimerase [Synechococcus sp. CBW1004]|uniref:NAD-dependent epimerase/dehydratase family protein n=1 Tax=Synechococcus sp. CBW1004 TaxID=1353136 RepID=UPI0018CEF6B9|nr:UDP-glucose 4-epimerase [Synechococcus sp. CBW1004]QPN64344.1 UDP-glucose 4-epimerase [Synechococcus sp. CBW1004]